MAEPTGRLVWDKTGERKYETGADRCVLYKQDSSGTYPNGVAWNGFTGFTESPSGAEATPLYANNGKYLNLYSAEEFAGTLTAYTYPDEFAECNGEVELTPGVTVSQQARKTFGLCYRTIVGNDTEGQAHGYKIHLVYGAVAAPSERAYATVNDSPEAVEMSYEISTTPVSVTGATPTASMTIDCTKLSEAAIKAIEDVLYGTDAGAEGTPAATAARLPLPDEVKQIISSAAAA